MSAIGPKRTSLVALHMSAFGGKADMAAYDPNQSGPLNVEIKMELKGVGPQRDGINFFFPLVAKPGFDDILGEYIAAEQKRMIGFECIERLLQRAGCGLHRLCFRGRQIVEVLVNRLTWINALVDAVKAGHQHCCECQVSVTGGIRRPELDPLGTRVWRIHRNPATSRTVALRIDQIDWRLIA